MLAGFCDKKNKDEQQLKQTRPTDIIKVIQSHTDIPDERTFLTKFVMVLRQEKRIYRNVSYVSIMNFSKKNEYFENEKLLVLRLKSYPQAFIKKCIENAGFRNKK